MTSEKRGRTPLVNVFSGGCVLSALFLASLVLAYLVTAVTWVSWSYKDYYALRSGMRAYKNGDYQTAVEKFKLASYGYERQSHFWASALIRAGKAYEVPVALDQPSRNRLEPDDLNVLAVGAMSGGRYGDPSIWLEEAVTRSPEEPAFHHNLSIAYERAGRTADAARERALAIKHGGAKYGTLKEPLAGRLDYIKLRPDYRDD